MRTKVVRFEVIVQNLCMRNYPHLQQVMPIISFLFIVQIAFFKMENENSFNFSFLILEKFDFY